MSTKKVSIIMGVYNCEATLKEAIDSIINQTYQNWEFVICDDGSSDKSFEIVKQYADSDNRFVVIQNDTNLGLNKTLNKCLKYATGEYIARMDGDDISLPDRFEKELTFLCSHPEYAIVSCPMILFDEQGDYSFGYAIESPTKEDVVCGSPICHAPVMMQKAALLAVNGYSEDSYTQRVEDVDLWIRLYCAGYKAYNLPEQLYKMRNGRDAFSRRKYKYRINSVNVRHKGCKALNLPIRYYFKSSMPMVVGLVPKRICQIIKNHQRK